jgi:hypothetical protein
VSNCAFADRSEPAVATEPAVVSSRVEELNKVKKVEDAGRQVSKFYFAAALILQQKSAFSLNDSHSFNRAEYAYTQH